MTPTDIRTSAARARRDWLDAARAVGEHKPTCIYCQHGQDCSERVLLQAAEDAAWVALEHAREAQP